MAEKKNILFILHLPPPVHGSSMVGKAIMESELINSSFECRYVNLLMSRTINETGKPGLIKILRFIRVWFSVLGEIIRKKPDLCYLALTASGTAFYKDFLLVLLLRIFRIKHIYHLHNKGVKQNQTSKLNNQLYRYVFSKAETILLSKQLYSDVESFVKASGVYFCPNGIKDTVMTALPRSHSEKAPVKLFFLSNLMKSKGVFVLLDACSILMQKKLDFECNFVGGEGDISVDDFNKYLIDNKLIHNIKYLGPKFGNGKQEVFSEADIFVHPTSNDCFPLVLLEAMQNQLPIISTSEGGIPDIVENDKTGFLIPKNNARALAEKLEILIKNPEMRLKMGKAGRLKYEKEFTMEIFEQNLHEILQKVIA
ncbi:MAG: glycosyl transferase group 1 [Bacteroidetes bacterium]|nr:glycosyl transferase group 1 [Bacteroidota bacterium]